MSVSRVSDRTDHVSRTTRSLVRRSLLGDEHSFRDLFGRLRRVAQGLAHGRVPRRGGLNDTGDIAQDVLIRAWRNLPRIRLERRGDLAAYVRQAVANRLRDAGRSAARTPELTEITADSAVSSQGPLHELLSTDDLRRYQQALSRLRPDERGAILARVEDGYSYEQIAKLFGKPSPAAARMMVQRAIGRLSSLIEH